VRNRKKKKRHPFHDCDFLSVKKKKNSACLSKTNKRIKQETIKKEKNNRVNKSNQYALSHKTVLIEKKKEKKKETETGVGPCHDRKLCTRNPDRPVINL